ncbi:MAG: DUF6446 family protein [Maritimibacter sp.]
MSGKLIGIFIVIISLIAGIAIYWLQVFAFYDEVRAEAVSMTLVNMTTGEAEALVVDEFQGIDGSSSPIRFRACFTTPMSDVTLSETYEPYHEATPLIAPGWFECFDAVEIGEAIEAGEALAFLSAKDITDGVDRVIAVFPDGRAFAWHQLNEKYQD